MSAPQERYSDLFQLWMESQNKIMENWREMYGSFFNINSNTEKNNSGNGKSTYQEMFHTPVNIFNEFFKQVPPWGAAQESFQKTMNAADAYKQLFELWNEMAKSVSLDWSPDKIKKMAGKWMESYRDIFDISLNSNLPEPMKSYFKGSSEILTMYNNKIMKFIEPWLNYSPEIQNKSKEALTGNKDAYLELLQLWRKTYEDSYGKIFNTPALGISREYFEKLLAGIDSYIKYTTSFYEFYGQVYKISHNTMEDMINKYLDKLKNGEQPKSFMEFYNFWFQNMENAYIELFKTDSFGKLLGQLINEGNNLKKRSDELMMEFMGNCFPVPTNEDMNSVYKNIHELKKMCKDQSNKIEKLEKKLAQLEENKKPEKSEGGKKGTDK